MDCQSSKATSLWIALTLREYDFYSIFENLVHYLNPEFDKNFVVRGDPERVLAFLNPDRRKALCKTFDLPDSVSVCGDSVLIEYTNRIKAATFEGNVRQCLAVTKLMMGGTVQRDGDLQKPHNL